MIQHALAIHTRKSIPLQTQGGMGKEKQNVSMANLVAEGKDGLAHKNSKVTAASPPGIAPLFHTRIKSG